MGTDCPLRVLGLPEDATSDEIRRAFRSLARQHHPDLGGDGVRFQEIRAAFDALRRKGRVADKAVIAASPHRPRANHYRTWLRDLDAAAALTPVAPTPEILLSAQPRRRSVTPSPSVHQPDSARRFAAILERELAVAG